MISFEKGNILHEQSDAILNTVNTVGVMGKGLALQFKRAFPHNFKEYKAACNNKELVVGTVLTVSMESITPPYYIINFPTKAHWKGKSKIEYLDAGLDSLLLEVERLNLKSVSIPPLGCGLGGLNWEEVSELIERKLTQAPGVQWRVFPPQVAPKAKDTDSRVEKGDWYVD